MRLLDAQVAICAVDRTAEHHEAASAAFHDALDGVQTLLIPWVRTLAFVRSTPLPARS